MVLNYTGINTDKVLVNRAIHARWLQFKLLMRTITLLNGMLEGQNKQITSCHGELAGTGGRLKHKLLQIAVLSWVSTIPESVLTRFW